MKKKYFLFFSLALTLGINLSCSTNLAELNNTKSYKTEANNNLKTIIIDLGYKGGASIKTQIKLNNKNGFNLKKSQNGFEKKVFSDLDHINLYLSPALGANPLLTKNIPSASFSSGITNILFQGLKPNSSYYLSAQAFADAGESMNITENEIANATEVVTTSVSNQITITPNTVDVDIWNIDIPLLNRNGAKIDSNIRLKNGTLGVFKINTVKVNKAIGSAIFFRNPDVAIDSFGNGMVVYNSTNTGRIKASYIKDYLPQDFDTDIETSGNVSFPSLEPSVALTSPNTGFVVWHRLINGSPTRIELNHLTSNSVSQVDDGGQAPSPQVNASVGMNGISSGVPDRAIFVWESQGTPSKIFGRAATSSDGFKTFSLSDSDTLSASLDKELTSPSGANDSFPKVSRISPTGDCLVIWRRDAGAFLSAMKINISPLGAITTFPEFTLYNDSALPATNTLSISLNDLGNGMVVWQGDNAGNQEIKAIRIINYQKNGSLNLVATMAFDETDPSVSLDDNGNGLITWRESSDQKIYAKKVLNYAVQGNKFRVTNSIGVENRPSVVINNNNKGIVVSELDVAGPSTFIYGNRILDLEPQ